MIQYPNAGPESGPAPTGIVWVFNWLDELKRLSSGGKN